ncbi:MAG: FKBP-type peptidyl-prolyl cis-trans isomerase [Victivallales bacterium]|nr:FKBP-type peptidyl-prolyl cis-trans isomerase [Victivallales bacterium]
MEFKNDAQKTSYALGLNMAMQCLNMPLDFSKEAFMEGFLDMVEDKKPQITQEEFTNLLEVLFNKIEEQRNHHHCDCGCDECGGSCNDDGCESGKGHDHEATAKAGAEYRAQNAKKPGVKITDSGLQVEIINPGEGKRPNAKDVVRVHYTGKLIDGTVFDSSVQRGEPIDFALNQVIPGWTEGLQHLMVGGKAILTIPPELAYGERGAGNVIPPNSTLVFEVELLDVR